MSERYTVKNTQEFAQSALDCPSQLSKYQIIYDNLIGKQFLRIALTCYTKVGISKASINIECRDKALDTIAKLTDVVVNEQCNQLCADFGKTVLIEIPNDTKSIKCTINQVVLCDGSKWTNTDENSVGNLSKIDFIKMPYLEHLQTLINKNKIFAKFVPLQQANYWQCTCGHLNSNNLDTCPCCGVDKKSLFVLFDEEFLRKDSIYHSATALMKAKNYISALNKFAEIPDYKSSKELSDKCIKSYLSDTLAPTETTPSIKTFEDSIAKLQKIENYTDIKPPIAYVERKRAEYVEKTYQTAIKTAKSDKTIAGYNKSIKLLEEIKQYKSVQKEIDDCKHHINDINKENKHKKNIHRIIIAAATFVVVAIIAILIPVFIDCQVYETYSNFTLEKSDGGYVITEYTGNKSSVTIPSSYLGTPIVKIGEKAFIYHNELTNITIGNNVKHIGDLAFYECRGLTSVTIGHGVMNIGSSAFSNCHRLTSVVIPDSVTSIGHSAFAHCVGLTSVTIHDSVTSIGEWAFSGCSGLTTISYQGTKAQWYSISKGSSWDYNTGNYTILCTDGDIKK